MAWQALSILFATFRSPYPTFPFLIFFSFFSNFSLRFLSFLRNFFQARLVQARYYTRGPHESAYFQPFSLLLSNLLRLSTFHSSFFLSSFSEKMYNNQDTVPPRLFFPQSFIIYISTSVIGHSV